MNDAHPYVADTDIPADHRGNIPCHCGLPRSNEIHNTTAVDAAQQQHRQRTGDREDNN